MNSSETDYSSIGIVFKHDIYVKKAIFKLHITTEMLVTALCRSTSVLRTLSADRCQDEMLSHSSAAYFIVCRSQPVKTVQSNNNIYFWVFLFYFKD